MSRGLCREFRWWKSSFGKIFHFPQIFHLAENAENLTTWPSFNFDSTRCDHRFRDFLAGNRTRSRLNRHRKHFPSELNLLFRISTMKTKIFLSRELFISLKTKEFVVDSLEDSLEERSAVFNLFLKKKRKIPIRGKMNFPRRMFRFECKLDASEVRTLTKFIASWDHWTWMKLERNMSAVQCCSTYLTLGFAVTQENHSIEFLAEL
jgi:hypothetical protein